MAISPFIEGKQISTTVIRNSGSINISVVQNVLQGIEKKNKFKYKGILPIIGTDSEDNTIKQICFGQEKDWDDSVPFSDKAALTTKAYLENSNSSTEFFVPSEGFNYSGIIEPLVIRDAATLSSIEGSHIAHSVKGIFCNGNTNIYLASDQIQQFIPFKNPLIVEPFEDCDDRMGNLLTASVKLPGFISDLQRKNHPFDETNFSKRNVSLSASLMFTATNAMTGSKDDGFIPANTKSASAGFTYYGSKLGTDSIAFGNLLRS